MLRVNFLKVAVPSLKFFSNFASAASDCSEKIHFQEAFEGSGSMYSYTVYFGLLLSIWVLQAKVLGTCTL